MTATGIVLSIEKRLEVAQSTVGVPQTTSVALFQPCPDLRDAVFAALTPLVYNCRFTSVIEGGTNVEIASLGEIAVAHHARVVEAGTGDGARDYLRKKRAELDE